MKDIENVTAHIGEGKVLSPTEEAGSAAAGGAGDSGAGAAALVNQAVEPPGRTAAPAPEAAGDPWQVLVSFGAQFVAALAAANDSPLPVRPSIESDPTGARHLKVPLPGQEAIGHLANAFSAMAETLRKMSA
jgi:hypothetical protein